MNDKTINHYAMQHFSTSPLTASLLDSLLYKDKTHWIVFSTKIDTYVVCAVDIANKHVQIILIGNLDSPYNSANIDA